MMLVDDYERFSRNLKSLDSIEQTIQECKYYFNQIKTVDNTGDYVLTCIADEQKLVCRLTLVDDIVEVNTIIHCKSPNEVYGSIQEFKALLIHYLHDVKLIKEL